MKIQIKIRNSNSALSQNAGTFYGLRAARVAAKKMASESLVIACVGNTGIAFTGGFFKGFKKIKDPTFVGNGFSTAGSRKPSSSMR